MLYFFLSYARGDDDVSVQKFFHDLSAEVRAHAGLSADKEVGFFDVHSLEVGATWSPRLVDALSRCQSFIALVSPRYVLSEPCGREWTIFADRLRGYERDVGVSPSVMLPLLWLPPQQMPDAVAAIQYQNDILPEAYTRTGLRQLMRLKRNHDHYYELITELARQIVQTAEAHQMPLAPVEIDFEDVPSAFHQPLPRRNSHPPDTPALPAKPGPHAQYVHFVVVAPTQQQLDSAEMAAMERDPQYYGETPPDWAPYRPTLPVPIADYARTVADRRSFRSGVADTSALAQRISEAKRTNELVVLIVDLWSTLLREHRQALAECNELDRHVDEPLTAVMVPLNHDDDQTQAHRRQLVDTLRSIFIHRAVHGEDVMFRTSILTHQSFGADLQVVLEAARNRLFRKGTVHNRPTGQTVRRPILQGP